MSNPKRSPAESFKTVSLPPHIAGWHLPPGWSWGAQGLVGDERHYQQLTDGLGRSLSLVTAPDPAHHAWLFSEARQLAHRNHPAIPTTYHYWVAERDARRGPGYLRRWITGETVRAHLQRLTTAEIPYVLQVVRGAGSTLSYLHDNGATHGAVTVDTVWMGPTGRLWMLEWQWAVPRDDIPRGMRPLRPGGMAEGLRRSTAVPPEWVGGLWNPTPATDQWQLAAVCFTALTGEDPPPVDVPPVSLLRPECPAGLAEALDRALSPDPGERFPSVAAFLRVADRGYSVRGLLVPVRDPESHAEESEEERIRAALGDDYEVLSPLGSGSFGKVWRARDLSLEREVALKVLHPHVAADARAVAAFWTEAKLAAQLAHPAIVPIFDWDSRDDLAWYSMELAEEGSVANLVERNGPREVNEIAPQVELIIDGLSAAHAIGIVHRDLKPENILIDRYGRWRMSDFGTANATGEDATGTTGTPAFAAPEQLLGEPHGAAVDRFALAAIVAYALSGHPPFGDGDHGTIVARQLAGTVDLTRFPPPIAEWLRCALKSNPEERFPDEAAMKEAWRKAVRATRRRERSAWWRRQRA
ncbi:MAG TPA: serine/threonine-protein kinase [Gemmatimonadaceae bacterium]|nr:serine/threonine-protein kinase [Gemmatimonadaceae bacterium]